MNSVINYYSTKSFCYKCQKHVDGIISYKTDKKVYLNLKCSCPNLEFIVENDYRFWDGLLTALKNNKNYLESDDNDNTAIDVTSRCNLQCKHCYYEPDNSVKDKPIEEILKLIKFVKTRDVVLVGAESTLRKDIFELIDRIAEFKEVSIHTNAQKLADINFVKELKKTRLKLLNISIHNDEYHSNKEVFNKAVKGLWNSVKLDIKIGGLAFVVVTQKDVQKTVDFIIDFEKKFNFYKKYLNLKNDLKTTKYLIYAPMRAGRYVKEEPEIFVSDLYKMFDIALANRNIDIDKEIFDGINTPYEVALKQSSLEGSIQFHAYSNAAQGFDLNIVSVYSKIRPNFITKEGFNDFIAHSIAVGKLAPDYLKSIKP